MKKIFTILISVMAVCACTDGWTDKEMEIINDAGPMHVYTVENPKENKVLHNKCKNLTDEMIRANEYDNITARMIATLKDPATEGVGIAGPQVGVLRRIVAVMRYDKPGIPYEAYPNIRIVKFNGETSLSSEGCLSVPDAKVTLPRYHDIEISYTDPVTLRDTTEKVTGFAAVIFQHECDHLDGILFTEKE